MISYEWLRIAYPLFNVKSGAESEASELRFSLTPRQFGIRSEREQVLWLWSCFAYVDISESSIQIGYG
jgi:hypothetical protein